MPDVRMAADPVTFVLDGGPRIDGGCREGTCSNTDSWIEVQHSYDGDVDLTVTYLDWRLFDWPLELAALGGLAFLFGLFILWRRRRRPR
jgi:hypothetical protein